MWKSFPLDAQRPKKAAIPRVKSQKIRAIHQEKAGKQSGKSTPRPDLSKHCANKEDSVVFV
jgi:hypothetical protein